MFNMRVRDITLRNTPGRNIQWLDKVRRTLCANIRDELNTMFPQVSFVLGFSMQIVVFLCVLLNLPVRAAVCM
jgi:hypothetical protein